MPIIGFSLKSVEAVRKGEITRKLEIATLPKIKSVKKQELNLVKEGKALSMEFELTINYEPKTAKIKMSGEILYTGNDIDSILKEWKKKKKLPSEVDIQVKNHLLRKCLFVAIYLAEKLQLPPPVAFPILVRKQK